MKVKLQKTLPHGSLRNQKIMKTQFKRKECFFFILVRNNLNVNEILQCYQSTAP